MLALTREVGERVIVGNPPLGTVEVVQVNGKQVRLAFNFPKSVTIRREEVPVKPPPHATDVQAQIDGHGLARANDEFTQKFHEVGHMPAGWVECETCGYIGGSHHTHERRRGSVVARECFRCWGKSK